MKVYAESGGERRLVGRCEAAADVGPVLVVPLFGGASIIREQYTVGTVTHFPPGGGEPVVERAVLLAAGQPPELLPGWQPLAS